MVCITSDIPMVCIRVYSAVVIIIKKKGVLSFTRYDQVLGTMVHCVIYFAVAPKKSRFICSSTANILIKFSSLTLTIKIHNSSVHTRQVKMMPTGPFVRVQNTKIISISTFSNFSVKQLLNYFIQDLTTCTQHATYNMMTCYIV